MQGNPTAKCGRKGRGIRGEQVERVDWGQEAVDRNLGIGM